MNVKEFKEWLNQFDDDVIVEVGIQQEADPYQSYGQVIFKEFTGDFYEDCDYTDFRGNPYVKESYPYYNTCILQLGGSK